LLRKLAISAWSVDGWIVGVVMPIMVPERDDPER
jgi:hypothetical protein